MSLIDHKKIIDSMNILNSTAIVKNIEELLESVKNKELTFSGLSNEKSTKLKKQLFADAIHVKECKHNHTDGCSYFYEEWDSKHFNNRNVKSGYLTKVNNILAKFPNLEVEEVFDLWMKLNS